LMFLSIVLLDFNEAAMGPAPLALILAEYLLLSAPQYFSLVPLCL